MQYPGQRVQIDVKVVPRRCIADPQLKLYQYTAIDEYSRYRVLGAYEEQSTFSSADFLSKVAKHFARKGVAVECIQTDNSFEFTNRFSSSQRDLETLFEATARQLGIRLIRPYTPRHNGKVERSHREDQKRFYGFRSSERYLKDVFPIWLVRIVLIANSGHGRRLRGEVYRPFSK